jgi:hypothetical protein
MVFSWERKGEKMKEVQEPVNYVATKYIAEDGKSFVSKDLCQKHEDKIKIDKIVNSLPYFKVDGEDWYKISTREEFNAWLKFIQEKHSYWSFSKRIEEYSFSKDWYRINSYYESRYEDTLSYPQSLSSKLESLNDDIKEAQDNLYNFQKEWNDAIK